MCRKREKYIYLSIYYIYFYIYVHNFAHIHTLILSRTHIMGNIPLLLKCWIPQNIPWKIANYLVSIIWTEPQAWVQGNMYEEQTIHAAVLPWSMSWTLVKERLQYLKHNTPLRHRLLFFCELRLSGWGTTSIMHSENSLISSYTIIIAFFWHPLNETVSALSFRYTAIFLFLNSCPFRCLFSVYSFFKRNAVILEKTRI